MKTIEDRIRLAVENGRKIRSDYFKKIDLPDEQELGPPASSSQIAELELRFGKSLPTSYRTFLCLHDGWRMVDGAMDLLSVTDMLEGSRFMKIKKWQSKLSELGDIVAANSLVIGYSDITATKLLLDPERQDDHGEWAVVQHHNYEEHVYPSFLNWIEDSVDEFQQLILEENDL